MTTNPPDGTPHPTPSEPPLCGRCLRRHILRDCPSTAEKAILEAVAQADPVKGMYLDGLSKKTREVGGTEWKAPTLYYYSNQLAKAGRIRIGRRAGLNVYLPVQKGTLPLNAGGTIALDLSQDGRSVVVFLRRREKSRGFEFFRIHANGVTMPLPLAKPLEELPAALEALGTAGIIP